MLKNNKGITLIALVVTIIVLLILAGVSIAMLTGDNGILTQSKTAKEETIKGEIADKINLTLNAEYANILEKDALSGDAAKIASGNGISTDDFDISIKAKADNAIILSIKPSATGAYKAYKDVSSLEGKIKYTTADGYSLQKAKK